MAQAALAVASPAAQNYERITVTRVSGSLGAEIGGVDLSRPLDPQTEAEIRRAFLEHCVIVFRGQDVPPDRQIAFTEMFGKVVQHPLYRSAQIEGYPEILVLEHKAGQFFNGRNDIWHSDLTFTAEPPLGSILHCKACWEGFGDTMFSNQYKAWDMLSDAMKDLLRPMKAEHSAALLQQRNNARPENVKIETIDPPMVHPVMRTHPETGRPALYVNPSFVTNFIGMTREESRPLLGFLYEYMTRLDFTYRHRWRVGDVVMFDNRCLLHYVVVDYPPEMHRRMHRTTAAGDRPY